MVAIETSLLATTVSLGKEKNQTEREEGGDELIWPMGAARSVWRVLRVLRTVSSMARLTKTPFSAVGAALTLGEGDVDKSCDSHSEEARDEHCQIQISKGCCEA